MTRRRRGSTSTTCPLDDDQHRGARRAGCSPRTTASSAAPRSPSTRASRSPAGWPAAAPTRPPTLLALRPPVGPAHPARGAAASSPPSSAATCRSRWSAAPRSAPAAARWSTPLMTRGEYWWVVLESDRGPVDARGLPRVRRAARQARSVGDPEIPDALMRGAARPRRRRRSAPAWPTTCSRPRCGCAPSSAPPWSRAGSSPRTARSLSGSGPELPVPLRGPRARRRRCAGGLAAARPRAGLLRPRAGARRPRRRPTGRRLTMAVAQPGQPRARAQGVRRPPAARRRQPRRRRRRADRRRRPQRRRQDHAAASCIGGLEEPDDGRVSRNRGLHLGFLTQGDDLDPRPPCGEAVLEGRADHEWAADSATREVVEVLLAGVSLDRVVDGLSGGERRRCSLARLLLGDHDLVDPRRADQPPRRRGRGLAGPAPARAVRPRWWWSPTTAGSSTRSAPRTWEVHDGVVDVYDGGYAAFVLAKAERQRQAAASEPRRQNLMRKELAWLRRGAPARTSKPKFRIDARQRADRGRAAAARPARAAAVRDPAARQGRRRRRGRRPGPRRADAARRTPPGGSVRATGSAWSASTAPARPPCCGWSPAS